MMDHERNGKLSLGAAQQQEMHDIQFFAWTAQSLSVLSVNEPTVSQREKLPGGSNPR